MILAMSNNGGHWNDKTAVYKLQLNYRVTPQNLNIVAIFNGIRTLLLSWADILLGTNASIEE